MTETAKLVTSLQSVAKLPDKVARSAVAAQLEVAVRNTEDAVKKATGGSSRLRNAGPLVRGIGSSRVVGLAGAALNVESQISPNGLYAIAKAAGPWQLIEEKTKPHTITPAGRGKDVLFGPTPSGRPLRSASGRASRKARDGRALALRTPYGLKRRVAVKGTRGKHPWRNGIAATQAAADDTLRRASKVEVDKLIR